MTSTMRLTIAIAVIMVEISDDVHMLLPVLVAIMVAKWVADAATHSIYHTLLEVKCVPFLVHEPASKFSLDLLPISTVMCSPVVCLELHMKVCMCVEGGRHRQPGQQQQSGAIWGTNQGVQHTAACLLASLPLNSAACFLSAPRKPDQPAPELLGLPGQGTRCCVGGCLLTCDLLPAAGVRLASHPA